MEKKKPRRVPTQYQCIYRQTDKDLYDVRYNYKELNADIVKQNPDHVAMPPPMITTRKSPKTRRKLFFQASTVLLILYIYCYFIQHGMFFETDPNPGAAQPEQTGLYLFLYMICNCAELYLGYRIKNIHFVVNLYPGGAHCRKYISKDSAR